MVLPHINNYQYSGNMCGLVIVSFLMEESVLIDLRCCWIME